MAFDRDGEDRFRYLVENAFDIILECAASGRILYVSPNIGEVLGYDPQAIVGTFLVDLLHPDDAAAGIDAFTNAVAGSQRIHATLRYRNARGMWRYLEGRGQSYATKEGKTRVVIIGRDVTDHTNAEGALRQLLRRMELQQAQTPVAVIAWDLEHRVVEWNPAAEKMFGYAKHEILGQSAQLLLPSLRDELDTFVSALPSEATARWPIRLTADAIAKSGALVASEWAIVPVLDDAGTATGFLATAEDISERRRAQKLEDLAYQDPVTGMPNRRYFDARLFACVEATRRRADAFGVLYVDIDNFKEINDSHGHLVGDAVLAAVGLRLRVCVRDSDVVARLGGDEFGILLTHVDGGGYVEEVAQRILMSLRRPLTADGNSYRVAASIGASTFPSDGTDPATLLRKADAAMYRAKKKGKSTYST